MRVPGGGARGEPGVQHREDVRGPDRLVLVVLPQTTTACRTIARFVADAHSLAREAADPEAAVDEIFQMIEAAWEAADRSR
ncbi:hypothetical protein GCM10022419_105380 [Nonomuraea rosea]|uniref:Uncharacterized protein n=1 Tax=Nonomuraea rosea TaxID=638574 RepID=A0ABP6ZCB3_9ACTN